MPLRTIIIKATRSGTASTVIIRRGASGTGTGGTSDHGALTGLGDDDHTQYLNNTRGDARYPSITYAGANPNHPQNLTITGVVTTGVNGTLVYCGLINGKAAWSSDGTQIAGVSNPSNTRVSSGSAGDIWLVERGEIYAANKASTAATPAGLTGWTIGIGSGQPVIAVSSTPTGTHIGQFCQASGGLWRWNGSAWFEVTATASSISNAAVLAALPSTTPLPITSGGTGVGSVGELGTFRTALGIPDPPAAKTATSDVTVSNQSGTLIDAARNDSQLNLFPVDANSTYRVTIYFEYSSTTTTAGIKIGVNFPSLAAPGTQRGGVGVTANGVLVNIPNGAAGLFQLTSAIGGTRVQLTGTIIARTGATGGFADFRWGQLTPSADPTTRHAGSTVTFEKIA